MVLLLVINDVLLRILRNPNLVIGKRLSVAEPSRLLTQPQRPYIQMTRYFYSLLIQNFRVKSVIFLDRIKDNTL